MAVRFVYLMPQCHVRLSEDEVKGIISVLLLSDGGVESPKSPLRSKPRLKEAYKVSFLSGESVKLELESSLKASNMTKDDAVTTSLSPSFVL